MEKIFINLPVDNIDQSANFYKQLGFTDYPLFTGANQRCVLWGEHIYLMLQTKKFFTLGNKKPLDITGNSTATFTLPVESIVKMNEIVEKGLNAGGKESLSKRDEGYMQVRTLEDLDGHLWGIIYLDINKFKEIKER